MKVGWYENRLYKEIGIILTHNGENVWYLSIDLWWWYLEIQFNKPRRTI